MEDEVDTPKPKKPHKHDWIEISAAILLSLATIASAWSAYQSTRWHGTATGRYVRANATRILSSEAADVAVQQLSVDAALFSDYCYAFSAGDTQLVTFYETRLFRPEMKKAVDAWKATHPLTDASAPKNPFDLVEYTNANKEKSKALEKEAQQITRTAQDATDQGDKYILLTVLFASVLFFAGISTKFGTNDIKIALLCLGGILFLGSLITLLMQPMA